MESRPLLLAAAATGAFVLLSKTAGVHPESPGIEAEKVGLAVGAQIADDSGEPHHKRSSYLSPEHTAGDRQSPINILTGRAKEENHRATLHYKESFEHIRNLGHTIEVDWDEGSRIEFDGSQYELVQFHFHTPAEHLLDGMTFPLEIHLVHRSTTDAEVLLVVGALFKEGEKNSIIEHVLLHVPESAGERLDVPESLDVSELFASDSGYYYYGGSLTTPPYSEVVRWLVLDGVHEASPEQIETIARIEGDNARHIQETHARVVEHCRFRPGAEAGVTQASKSRAK